LSKKGFKVMDSDMHILEPVDLWDRYMEAAHRGRVQNQNRYIRDLGVALDGKLLNFTGAVLSK
jgi:hypothetical protein